MSWHGEPALNLLPQPVHRQMTQTSHEELNQSLPETAARPQQMLTKNLRNENLISEKECKHELGFEPC